MQTPLAAASCPCSGNVPTRPTLTSRTVRAFYCDHFVLPLPDGHRFPMEKYALLRERIAGVSEVTLAVPAPATNEQLLRVHSSDYLSRIQSGSLERDDVRRIGFPWSPQLVERSRRSVGGTIEAARAALADGAAANLAGGTHHAFADRGEGFCVFNDVAVSIRDAQAEWPSLRAAVVDLDVHQGNGTAHVFADDPSVFTVSVHGGKNYPFRKERSDLDIELADGTTDERFLDAVRSAVDAAVDFAPDLVYYVAGADAFEGDRLGRLGVSKRGLAARDEILFSACENEGLPVVVVMAGGYAEDVGDTVSIHEASVRRALTHASRARPGTPPVRLPV